MSEENSTESVDSEKEASGFGWVPKEEFRGNPEEWKDAETFLRRGKEINGFLRNDLEKIKRTAAQDKAELLEMRETMDEFRKYHNETEARAYKRAVTELKQAKVEAIEQGNGARVIEIDDQIESLKKIEPVVKETKPKPDIIFTPEELTEWQSSNVWYGKDKELSELVDDFADIINKKNPGLKGKDFLAEISKKVKAVRPDVYENPNRDNSSVSSSNGSRPTDRKGKTYADLPSEAKAACDKFVKQKLVTQADYIREYFSGE